MMFNIRNLHQTVKNDYREVNFYRFLQAKKFSRFYNLSVQITYYCLNFIIDDIKGVGVFPHLGVLPRLTLPVFQACHHFNGVSLAGRRWRDFPG